MTQQSLRRPFALRHSGLDPESSHKEIPLENPDTFVYHNNDFIDLGPPARRGMTGRWK